MDIPIPPNYRPHKPSNGNGYQRYRPDKCYAKEVSINLQQEHQKKVYSIPLVHLLRPVCPPYFPVCPVLKEIISKEKHYSLPDIPKTNLPLLDSIIKILLVFNDLTQLKPNWETVVRWAHSENLLKERLDLIRNDLSALPQWLEKDYPKTSEECKELVTALQLVELRYSMHGQSFVYLLPNNLEFGNWATFLRWREQQVNLANPGSIEQIEMCRLTRHYPAEAIEVMHKLYDELSPLLKILPEQAVAQKKRLQFYIQQIIEKLSDKTAGAEKAPASGKAESTKAKKGRQKKYTPEMLKAMQKLFDDEVEKQKEKDVKAAWSKVAEVFNIKNAKAAEMAVRRHQKQNK